LLYRGYCIKRKKEKKKKNNRRKLWRTSFMNENNLSQEKSIYRKGIIFYDKKLMMENKWRHISIGSCYFIPLPPPHPPRSMVSLPEGKIEL
jgi:hypothetical protein